MTRLRAFFASLTGFLLLVVLSLSFSSSVAAQTKGGINGSWYWEGHPDKSGSRAVVGFTFTQRGNRVSGTYYVSSTGGPEDDTTDAASIPFIGTISGNVIKIEYDPEDLHTIDEKNYHYRRPKGKLPSTATLTLKNGRLELTQTRGELADKSMNVPRQFTMRPSK